jgi:hypothetical protein
VTGQIVRVNFSPMDVKNIKDDQLLKRIAGSAMVIDASFLFYFFLCSISPDLKWARFKMIFFKKINPNSC